MDRAPRSDERVELVERKTAYQGYFRLDAYRLRHRTHDGDWTDVMSREVFERGHAAAVLLYDPDRDRVVMIEQFRIGAYAAGVEPWLIEVVAGIIEPGEDAAEVVRREAVEEAGCEIAELLPVATVLLTPGASSETLAVFCGRVDSAGAGGIYGLDHEHEDIRVFTASPEEALRDLMAQECPNANALIPLQWLLLNREEVRQRWRSGAP